MSMQKSGRQPGHTRRSFVQASGATLATLGATSATLSARPKEALALNGGTKVVTFPEKEQAALSKWPRYGASEKQALHDEAAALQADLERIKSRLGELEGSQQQEQA